MKKTFKLNNLDCAACGAKMENAINKISLVDKATVSFMTQRLTLETSAEGVDFENLMNEIKKTVARIEPDCTILM